MHARLLQPTEYAWVPWKNGRGVTREILVAEPMPNAHPPFLYRLSMAEVTEGGSFSTFAGIDRGLLLLSGEGMRLDSVGQDSRVVEPSGPPVFFSGDWQTQCQLLGGPCRDLNLMWDRSRLVAQIEVCPLPCALDTLHKGVAALILFSLDAPVQVQQAGGESLAVPHQGTLVFSPEPDEPVEVSVRGPATARVARFVLMARGPAQGTAAGHNRAAASAPA